MEIYNLISSGKQKTPSTTTSTAWYHPWAFSRRSFSLYKPQSTGAHQAWVRSNKLRSETNQRCHGRICFKLHEVLICSKPDSFICEFIHRGLKNRSICIHPHVNPILCTWFPNWLMAVQKTSSCQSEYDIETVRSVAASAVKFHVLSVAGHCFCRDEVQHNFVHHRYPCGYLCPQSYTHRSLQQMGSEVHEVRVVMQHGHRV